MRRAVRRIAAPAGRAICTPIVAAGGDYLLPVDDNQPALQEDLAALYAPLAADGA
jgi:hypothetical protein